MPPQTSFKLITRYSYCIIRLCTTLWTQLLMRNVSANLLLATCTKRRQKINSPREGHGTRHTFTPAQNNTVLGLDHQLLRLRLKISRIMVNENSADRLRAEGSTPRPLTAALPAHDGPANAPEAKVLTVYKATCLELTLQQNTDKIKKFHGAAAEH